MRGPLPILAVPRAGRAVVVKATANSVQAPGEAKPAILARGPFADLWTRQILRLMAQIALDATTLRVDGRDVALVPGMAATVEVRTGERRILDFLLDPVTRRGQESLRER